MSNTSFPSRSSRRGVAFEPLESRLLLSADLVPAADALAPEPSLVPAEHRSLAALEPAPLVSMRLAARELVFVDGSIADRDRLLADFLGAAGSARAFDVVVLDPARDGLAQIGEALAGRSGLAAVHVLGHGADGALALGGTTLDTATLAARADAIAAWGAAFAADGDFLLYGCDVASSARGVAFLAELARVTGADVAASDDVTGAAARGGDWDLEYASGAIETPVVPVADATWGGLLTTQVLDWDDPAIDWPAAGLGSNSFAVGGANVTITVADPSGYLNNGSPDDDALVDLGGLGAIEQGLYVSSTGFDPGESATITLDFAHPGGVSNVSFTIFDIDRGGGPNFIDEIQAAFTASGTVTLAIANGPNNIVVGGDTVQGTASAPSNGANSGDANATFTFTGNGITQITLNYRNVGGATGQSVTIHDISFDPTPTAANRTVTTSEDTAYTFAAGDFGFADVGGDTLQAVRVTQLESAGSLRLNGVDVLLNQVIAVADINAGLLTFTPAANAVGAPYANFRFEVSDGVTFSAADHQMRIDVVAANDAPVLAGANDFGAIAEDPAVNAGTAVSVLVAGQVTDIDAGALAGIAVTAVDDANGTWQYSTNGGGSWNPFAGPTATAARLLRDTDLVRLVPAADWHGTATMSFRAWDRTSGVPGGTADTNTNGNATAFSTAVHTSSIAVSAVGDTVNDAAPTNEDNAVAFNVLANDSFENAGRTLTAVAGAANGGVSFTAAGAVTYTPNLHWNGTETLTYTITSGGVTETGTLTVTVNAVNDVPTLTLGANQTVAEDAAAQTVAGFATAAPGGGADEAGQTFGYTVTNDNNAMFAVQPSIAANGTLTYTLAANAFGTANVTVTVTDSGGVANGGVNTSAPGAFTITATPVADTPSVTNAATLEDVQTAAGLVISRNAADGAEVTHFRITGIAGGTLFLNDGTTSVANGTFITAAEGAAGLKFTPSANSIAAGSFDVQASTAANAGGLAGGVVTATITVTAVNDVPTLAIGANQTVAEDTPAQTVVAFATAAPGGGADEAGQTFTYAVTNDDNAMFVVQPSIAANGTLTYTLAANAFGTANVSVSVTDSGGGTDTTGPLAFTITATPVADTPAVTNAATLEDVQTTVGLVISPNAADGAEVTHFQITGIAGGTLFFNDGTTAIASGTFITAAQGAAGLKFTPNANSVAAGSFDVQASTAGNAGGLGGGVVTATIGVTAVNDEPSFTIGGNLAVAEDAAPQTIAGYANAASGGGGDEAGQTFSYTVTNDNNALFTVQPSVAADGTLTYTLALNTSGAATVTLFVTDSGGTANLGDDTAPTQTFTIAATAVADAPTLVVNAPTGNEDTPIGLSITPALVDTDGSETLTLSVSSIPIGATLTDGVSSFTATLGNTATAITGWNLAALTVLPPLHGDVDFTLVVAATATEGAGGAAVTTANLAVTVTAVADAPTLVVNAPTGNEDTPIGLSITPALVDADGSEVLTLSVSSIPIGATLTDGVSSFTATLGNTATAITGWNLAALTVLPPLHSDVDFTLVVAATATEGAGGTATTTANLAVAVTAIADAPTLTVNAPTGNEDTPIGLSITPALVDADGSETLTLSVSSIPIGATLTDGVSSFTATLGNTATAITGWNLAALTVLPPLHSDADFTLVVAATATEGAGGSTAVTTANLAVTVTAIADTPTLTVNAPTGNEDTPIGLSITPALVDADGSETLTLSVSSIPIGATLTDGVSSFIATLGNTVTAITGWNLAALTVLPPLHSDADFTLVVAATATEGAGGSTAVTTANLAVTVTAIADTPTLAVNAPTGNEDTPIGLSITPALVDTDGSETLTLSVSSIPVGATLTDGLNSFTASLGNTVTAITGWNLAALTVLPPLHSDADFTLVVAATATEGAGGTAVTTANLAVTVTAVADAPTLAVNAPTGNEDTPIGLSITPALVDTDGSETLTLSVSSIPVGATLSDGLNNFTATLGNTVTAITGWNLAALTVLPPLHSDIDFTLVVAATATEGAGGGTAVTTANLAVTVGAVADAPTLTVNAAAGDEDTAITLSITPALMDTDGSETLALSVSSIPVGATLSDGLNNFTATLGNTVTAITGWNLAALTVLPPLHSDIDFTLVVAATATEGAGGSTAVTTANLAVTVGAVADAPMLAVNAPTGNEDAAIALLITPALVDTDGSETLTLSVSSIPVGATLTDGVSSFTASLGNTATAITGWNLAALTVLPPLHSDVDFTLVVAATATEGAGGTATTTANLVVTVTAVADAPTLAVNTPTGNEDTAIALSITPALVDTDGSEMLTLAVSSIPVGATLSDGVSSFTSSLGNTAAAITGWNLAALTVLPPLHSDADFTLVVAATATEGAGGSIAVTTANLTVTVTAVADAPTVVTNPAAVNEDSGVALGVTTALVDPDGSETLAVAVSAIPIGATLTDGVNTFVAAAGSQTANVTGWTLAALTLTPAPNDDADFTLTVTATSTEGANGASAATAANLAVTVTAVADAPALAVNPAAGNEDTAIALAITPALVDTDGSETLTLTVSAIPVGATLSDGVNTFTATAGNQSVNVTGWNLAALTALPPLHSDVDFALVVATTATEGANGAAATTTANLAVTVDAVADAPSLAVNAAAGNEDTAIALAITPALVDTDGSETLTLTVSAIPVGATLSDGVNTFTATAGNQTVNVTGWNLAALTITPAANADADFSLTVTATSTEAENGSTIASVTALAVDVLPVNDAPTVAAPGVIDVIEDVASPLLGISFGDVDAGASFVTATFTVAQGTLAATAGGGIAVGGTATARTITGTLAGINAFLAGGGLSYTTVLDATAPVALTASLDDLGNTGSGGALASPAANVTLDVTPVNDAPVLGNVALAVEPGGTVVLTGANLSATDVDDPLAGLVFFITGLQNGRFELVGAPGVPISTFTQGQVLAGQVQFVQTDMLRAPSYIVFVTDGASTVGPGIVALSFRAVIDPGVGAGVGTALNKEGRDATVLPTVSFAGNVLDALGGGLADPFAIRFNRAPVVATDGGEAAPAEAELPPAAGTRDATAKTGDAWEFKPRGFAYPELGFGEMDRLPTAVAPLEFGVGPDRPHEELRGVSLALDAIRTAGLVMSVGAVWWAARAAGLVGSLLASTPAWRHMDPLPVLGRDGPAGGWEEPEGEEATKEDASATKMFEADAKQQPTG